MTADLTALMHPADATAAYLTGQLHPSQGALLEAFAAESDATLSAYAPALDIPYGAHPRAVFDVYRSALPWRGTLAFLHAGFWQARDKAPFRFLAPAFLAAGVDVVFINYPLCPDVSLRSLVETVRGGVSVILAHLKREGRGGDTMVVAGHSAGGHIAVELALTDWRARGLAASSVHAIVPISGIYDLAPLRDTRLNDKLLLDAAEAQAMSPLHRVAGTLPPAHFIVGGLETPAFRAQSEAMHGAWVTEGGESALQQVEGADHFSLLRALAADGAAFAAVMGLTS
ncbi:alpha/beta hydrolase [Beijerinckia sp. L45]|uniref:alpha/beta hydrolase n=1 Tax=Beijerinckia sp. L45 TaxID=1641855 RepID=UPI001AEF04EE|nr:alpha/beta hydrolase [Beijerinckia sp. L45]